MELYIYLLHCENIVNVVDYSVGEIVKELEGGGVLVAEPFYESRIAMYLYNNFSKLLNNTMIVYIYIDHVTIYCREGKYIYYKIIEADRETIMKTIELLLTTYTTYRYNFN